MQLLRGGTVVANLLGAFGQDLKETRLTACLGFLVAMQADEFAAFFGFTGTVQDVQLETRHADGRSDILVTTTEGRGVIEAKVDGTDASNQSMRYAARWRVVLSLSRARPKNRQVRLIHWHEIAKQIETRCRTASPGFKFLATQFIAHLKEHHMIRSTEPWEIYAREINEPVTLDLFLRGHIYGCSYEKGQKVAKASYFAPHFGAELARRQPGIFQGLSYVARIDEVVTASGWKEFRESTWKARGKTWWNSNGELMEALHKSWDWPAEKCRSFLLLGEPRLVFNPPVRKERLQSGKGWLSRRFFSFDELFEAWGR